MKRQIAKAEMAQPFNTELSREQIELNKRITLIKANLGLALSFTSAANSYLAGTVWAMSDLHEVKFTYYKNEKEYLADCTKANDILTNGGDLSEELYTKLLKSKQEIDTYHEAKYANVKPKIAYTDK